MNAMRIALAAAMAALVLLACGPAGRADEVIIKEIKPDQPAGQPLADAPADKPAAAAIPLIGRPEAGRRGRGEEEGSRPIRACHRRPDAVG